MIDLEEPLAGERNSKGNINETLNNITILSVTAFTGKNYGLKITATGLKEGVQLTICITAYYLVKLLRSFEGEQLAVVEECVSKIERGSFVEGDIYEFGVPLKLKPEINIRVSRDSQSKIKSNIKSLSNTFYAKGISKKYEKVDRQKAHCSSDMTRYRIPNLLVKSYILYEEYKKEGFGEFFSRKICGLENDMLFELAKLYANEDRNSNDD